MLLKFKSILLLCFLMMTSQGLWASSSFSDLSYVSLTCETVLTVKRRANKSSPTIDDIDCKMKDGKTGNVVIVLDEKDGFYQIYVNGKTGWISSDYTSDPKKVSDLEERVQRDSEEREQTRPQTESKPKGYEVGTLTCQTHLRMRKGPSTRYRIYGRIPCNSTRGGKTKLKVLGRSSVTGWYYVDFGGEKGWVSDRYVNISSDSALASVVDSVTGTVTDPGNLGTIQLDCYSQGNCLPYSPGPYKERNSGRKFSEHINYAARQGTNQKKKKFLEIYAPMAIHLQKVTGWPASVLLAQVALETSWGTSGVLRQNNNIGGHSCWSYSANATRSITHSGLVSALSKDPALMTGSISQSGSVRVPSPCTYPRPPDEGGYYRTFSSVADSMYLYANNVLTNKAYRYSQQIVLNANAKGVRANPTDVIRGLRAYAEDPDYRDKLIRTINANDLTQYDRMNSCR